MNKRKSGRKTTGTVARPASFAARSRRSPVTTSYPWPVRRTTIGCRIPTSRIDAANSASVSSSNRLLGCFGLGAIALAGTSRSPVLASPASGAPGIRSTKGAV